MKKILVVDDDKSTLYFCETILKSYGYDVTTLNYPKKVVKLIKDIGTDLVVVDILMPYKDGYKVCEEIKEAYGDKVKVIVCTSKTYEIELIEEAYKSFGADDFLTKPFEPNELTEKIEKLVGK